MKFVNLSTYYSHFGEGLQMLASGNGNIETCVLNLLRLTRGTVPFERMKGVKADWIDQPSSTAPAELIADAEWTISVYEPRASGIEMDVGALLAKTGAFAADVEIETD